MSDSHSSSPNVTLQSASSNLTTSNTGTPGELTAHGISNTSLGNSGTASHQQSTSRYSSTSHSTDSDESTERPKTPTRQSAQASPTNLLQNSISPFGPAFFPDLHPQRSLSHISPNPLCDPLDFHSTPRSRLHTKPLFRSRSVYSARTNKLPVTHPAHLQYSASNPQLPTTPNTPPTPTLPRPKRLARNMAQPQQQQLDFLTPDAPLIPLPPFPYDFAELKAEETANITPKQLKIQKLQAHYNAYQNISDIIEQAELTPAAQRNQQKTNFIVNKRHQLREAYQYFLRIKADIDNIISIQDKLKPALHLYPDPINPDPLRMSDMKEFMNATLRSGNKPCLREIWKKLRLYAETNNISHESFRLALFACLTGDTLEYALEYRQQPMPEFAKKMANRFIVENTVTDATHSLDNFSRKLNEPIRQAVARLQSFIDKALLTHPLDQRDTVRDFLTKRQIRSMVTPTCRSFLDSKEAEYRGQGLRMQLPTLIQFAHEEEQRSGMPQSTMSNPVTLYNLESQAPFESPAEKDSRIDQLSNRVEQLTAMHNSKIDQLTSLIETMAVNNAQSHQPYAPYNPNDEYTFDGASQFEPLYDHNVNVLTRANMRANPQQSAKVLTKPSNAPPTPSERMAARRQQTQNKRAQYADRNRNLADTEQAPVDNRILHRSDAVPQQRPPIDPAQVPLPETDRSRPRNRSQTPITTRYPSYSREVLQYPVPEPRPSPATLSPADYYKEKAQRLAEALARKRQSPSPPRRDRARSKSYDPRMSRDRQDREPTRNQRDSQRGRSDRDQSRNQPNHNIQRDQNDYDRPPSPTFPSRIRQPSNSYPRDQSRPRDNVTEYNSRAPLVRQPIPSNPITRERRQDYGPPSWDTDPPDYSNFQNIRQRQRPYHDPNHDHPDTPYPGCKYPHGPTVLHTHDNTQISINNPCQFCHSPIKHDLENCYSLQNIVRKLAQRPNDKPSENK